MNFLFRFFILFIVLAAHAVASIDHSEPLAEPRLKVLINTFDPYAKILPNGVSLKQTELAFGEPQVNNIRTTKAKKSKFLVRETILPVTWAREEGVKQVGFVTLRETPNNPNVDGNFSLHMIKVHDLFQGMKLGSSILDMVILLSQTLAQKSSFYNRLTLQCSDYDEFGNALGNVPYRLSYYLNHGFTLDERTKNFMKVLDVGFFLQTLTVKAFQEFLIDYSDGQWSKVSYDLKTLVPHAAILLSTLQNLNPIADNYQEEVFRCAESSSSNAAQRIIDRMHYNSTESETILKSMGHYIYIMHLDVNQWGQALGARKAYRDKQALAPIRSRYNVDQTENLLGQIYRLGMSLTPTPSPLKRQAGKENSRVPRKRVRV